MKKAILVLSLSFLAIMSQAQGKAENPAKEPKTMDQKVNSKVEKMATTLELSEEQKKAITPIMKTRMVAMEKEKEKMDAAKAEMERIKKESDKQVMNILNEKQKMQYESEMYNQKENVKSGKGAGRQAPAAK
jgi:Spy/CpxP family protein refolding chaperone